MNFSVLNYIFKVKLIKMSLSIWHLIPNNIIKIIGGLSFLLKCNYAIKILAIKLSMFHQQALLAWKLCYTHNFSPHKTIIWNNGSIISGNKSIYKQNWINKNIIYVSDLFDNEGLLLSYERFICINFFPHNKQRI